MGGLGVQFASTYEPFDLKQVRGLPKYVFDDEAEKEDAVARGNRPFAQGLCWTSYFVMVFTAITMFNAPARAGNDQAARARPVEGMVDSLAGDASLAAAGFELRGAIGE
ncbi:MAG: hypothetical protein KDJ80_04795 [Nitratireductor sp.]|nr:hypothetical protein [Nitratireductor sp.]